MARAGARPRALLPFRGGTIGSYTRRVRFGTRTLALVALLGAPAGALAQQAPPQVPPPPGAEPPAEQPPPPSQPEPDRLRLVVIDAASFGIDPVVGRVASARMRTTGEELGYTVLAPEDTVAAAQQLRMPYPPTPADLWRVSWVARAQRGAFARIWAHGGQYVIEIVVASLDGGGPFFARGTAGADDLREVVDRLLRTALPPPSVWNAQAAQAAGQGQGQPPPVPVLPAQPETPIDELDSGAPPVGPIERPEPPPPEEPEPELRRWQLTLQTEGAIGAASEVFYNHLVGLRLDFRITRDIMLGAYVAYANLNARNGRADNLLFMLQFENRIRISRDLDLTIPLRAAVGYLPFNGPVIRLAAGINYALSPNWEIGADIITPTFWILADGNAAVSLDIAIEATYRF
jgi:hypothetical protein